MLNSTRTALSVRYNAVSDVIVLVVCPYYLPILHMSQAKVRITGLGNGNSLRIPTGFCLSIPVEVLKIADTKSFACLSRSTNVCNISVNHVCALQKEVTGVSSSFLLPSLCHSYSPFVTHFPKHFPLPLAPLVHDHYL